MTNSPRTGKGKEEVEVVAIEDDSKVLVVEIAESACKAASTIFPAALPAASKMISLSSCVSNVCPAMFKTRVDVDVVVVEEEEEEEEEEGSGPVCCCHEIAL